MFDSLDEQMKHDKQAETTGKERLVQWVMIGLLSVLLFGGLFFGVRMLQ